MWQVVFGEEALKKLKDFHLSNVVIASKFKDISDDSLAQVITGIKNSSIRVRSGVRKYCIFWCDPKQIVLKFCDPNIIEYSFTKKHF